MSRQKGTRRPPKPERRAYVDRYAKRKADRVVAKAEAFKESMGEPRRWRAVGLATLLLVFGYFSVIGAVAANEDGEVSAARTAMIMAALVAPLSLAVLGRVSQAPTPVRTALVAGPLAIAGFALVGSLTGDSASALVLSFGIAGAVAMRTDSGVHSVWRRIGTVGFFLIATVVIRLVSAEVAVTVAPLFPFVATGITDMITEREFRRPEQA